MKLAMNLAKQRLGHTGLNPSVGSVIVKNNAIISFGQTGFKGRPHSEYEAIKKCSKKKLDGSSIYITMEPCTHYGKTSPCTNLIIKSNIKKVLYSVNDVDKRTAKKAYSTLKFSKVNVSKGLLKSDAKKIYQKYFKHKNIRKPFVVAKIACSKDFFTTSKKKYITNEHSRKVSHLLRYQFDSILVTSKTINCDNEKLSCRINGLENYSPIRLILDKKLKINKKSYIVNDVNKNKTIIFHSSNNKKKINYFKLKKIRLCYIDLDEQNNIDIKKVFSKAYELGISSIIIEGGKTLTNSLFKSKLVNEFYLFKSDKNLGKLGNNNIFSIKQKISSFFKRKENIKTFLKNDQIIKYY